MENKSALARADSFKFFLKLNLSVAADLECFMNRFFVGVIAGVLAVLLFATGMIANIMEPEFADTPVDQVAGFPHSTVDSSGISLALLSILLGGGMVFMFRPRRRIYC